MVKVNCIGVSWDIPMITRETWKNTIGHYIRHIVNLCYIGNKTKYTHTHTHLHTNIKKYACVYYRLMFTTILKGNLLNNDVNSFIQKC